MNLEYRLPLFLFFLSAIWSANLFSQVASNHPHVRLERLSLADGLSQSTVRSVYQDHEGFIWLGTQDGLNLYDGYSFEVFRSQPMDTASLSDNQIQAITEDRYNQLWVGTSKGLSCLDRKTLKFKHYFSWFNDPHSLSNNKILSLFTDSKGRIWVGTENGLNLYQEINDNFRVFHLNPEDSTSISGNQIRFICEDRFGDIWIATNGGVNKFQESTQSFIRIRESFALEVTLSSNNTNAVAVDTAGTVWIGTEKGLDVFNPKKNTWKHYVPPGKGEVTTITNLLFDDEENLWIGTSEGLATWDPVKKEIIMVNQLREGPQTIGGNGVNCLLEDQSGLIWIGSEGAGIFTLDRGRQYIRHYSQFNRQKDFYYSDNTRCFYQWGNDSVLIGTADGLVLYRPQIDSFTALRDEKKNVLGKITYPVNDILSIRDSVFWIGTYGEGIFIVDPKRNKIEQKKYRPEQAGLSSNKINDLLYDGQDKIYIATNGGGLSVYSQAADTFITYKYNPANPLSIKDNNILCLEMDDAGNIWMGTSNSGLYRFHPAAGVFKQFAFDPWNANTIGSNVVQDLLYTSRGNMWIATRGGGLNLMNTQSIEFTRYSTDKGLANDVVFAIVRDSNKNLWLSTNKGLALFDVKENAFRNYGEHDGLVSNNYNNGSSIFLSSGLVVFGGITGFDVLEYQNMEINRNIPIVRITSFSLLEQDEKGQMRPLFFPTKYQTEDTLVLSHMNPGFTLEFASLDYRQPGKNQFAYKLNGLINDWTFLGERNFASFTSLDPGNYTFRVKATNNDGVWNEDGAVLYIMVLPAFYQTTWFRITTLIVIGLLLWFLYKVRVEAIQNQKKELQLLVQERTREIAKERDTNVTLLKEIHHRVKNNLQIITSLLSLQSRYVEDQEVISLFDECQNRIRSMSLIHQKMYKTKDLSSVNIEEYITDLVNSLIRTYKMDETIDLELNVNVNRFESDTLTPLGLIINEIISNSLKYAFRERKHGKITVKIDKLIDNRYRLLIGDDGIGMGTEDDFGESESFGTELISALTEQLNGTLKRLKDQTGTVYEIIFEDIEN